MKRNEFLFLLITGLLIPFSSISQSLNSKYIITQKLLKAEDGLASNEVLCGMQDSKGFLWFGTRNGLNRYDGKNFLLFTKQKNNMRANKVAQLAEDGNGKLWIRLGTSGSNTISLRKIDILDLNSNQITPISLAIKNLPFPEDSILWFQQIADKEIMIITNSRQIWIYNSTTGARLKCKLSSEYSISTSESFFSKDFVMITYFGNGHEFIFKDTAFVSGEETGIPLVLKNKDVLFYKNQNNKQSNDFSTYTLNTKGKKTRTQNLFAHHPGSISAYDFTSNSVLFYEDSATFLFDGKESVKVTDKKENNIAGNFTVNNCFTDYKGNRWLCTSNGVWKTEVNKNNFTHYFTSEFTSDKKKGVNNQVRGIFEDGKTVYANVWNRFYYSPVDTPESYKYIQGENIFYPLIKSNETVFTAVNGLYWFNRGDNKLEKLQSLEKPDELWALYPLNDTCMLEGSRGEIAVYNIKLKTTRLVDFKNVLPQPYFVYRFVPQGKDVIWALSELAIYKLNSRGEVLDCFSNLQKDSSKLLPVSNLMDLWIDKDGIFWITTSGEGLWSWDRKNNSFIQYTIADGIPTNLLYCVREDSENNLWISSDLGLIRFNKKDFTVHTYTVTDGLTNNEFNRTSAFQSADGRMYFGGLDGVNAFYPKDFTSDDKQLNIPMRVIAVSKISGDNDKMEDKTLDFIKTNKLVFNPGDRFATVEFMLLDYDEGKKRYSYKIEGLDNDWNYTFDNKISVSGLPYGDYKLLIKGQFANGQWSSSQLVIPVFVLKPFYLKWGFVLSFIVCILILIILIIRSRTQRLNKDKIRLQKEVENQTQHLNKALEKEHQLLGEKEVLLKEVHHRVKNNLQVISGLLELQSKSVTDIAAKEALLEGKSRVRSVALIHQNLYQFENMGTVELNTFVNDLQKQLNGIFNKENNKIEFFNSIPFTEIDIDTAVPLGLVVNELFTNSYKYAFHNFASAKIEIHLQTINKNEGRNFVLKYKDNGIGLPKDFDIKKAKSLGLRLIADLCKQLKGNVKYEFDNGSLFTIEFTDKDARKNFE